MEKPTTYIRNDLSPWGRGAAQRGLGPCGAPLIRRGGLVFPSLLRSVRLVLSFLASAPLNTLYLIEKTDITCLCPNGFSVVSCNSLSFNTARAVSGIFFPTAEMEFPTGTIRARRRISDIRNKSFLFSDICNKGAIFPTTTIRASHVQSN